MCPRCGGCLMESKRSGGFVHLCCCECCHSMDVDAVKYDASQARVLEKIAARRAAKAAARAARVAAIRKSA